jgi:hypothetical protein
MTANPEEVEMSEQEAQVAAGPIRFVVEHRNVGEDGGPTVRVMGSADDHEYLRFDMFRANAHYHYEPPDAKERIVNIDTVAVGDSVDWVIERLRERLSPMLTEAGGAALAGDLDGSELAGAVDEVEKLVRNAP